MIRDLVPSVRRGLGVSSSYDDEDIPDLIGLTISRLLRDYHFPKSVVRTPFVLAEGDQSFQLPAGFKKELELRIFNPADSSWTDPLVKSDRFRLPYPSGAPYYYWLEGTQLWIDTPIDLGRVGFSVIIWHESMSADDNEAWITDDFPAAVKYLSILRGAAEFRKPEVMQTYSPLWTDEQTSLAVYLEELQWNNVEIMQREAKRVSLSRYPPC